MRHRDRNREEEHKNWMNPNGCTIAAAAIDEQMSSRSGARSLNDAVVIAAIKT